jgi:hypothetical protein
VYRGGHFYDKVYHGGHFCEKVYHGGHFCIKVCWVVTSATTYTGATKCAITPRVSKIWYRERTVCKCAYWKRNAVIQYFKELLPLDFDDF